MPNLLNSILGRISLPVPRVLLGRPVWSHSRVFARTLPPLQVQRWIADRLCPGDTFFDVGAHHGWLSLVAARATGPTGTVVAFEPSPPSLRFLAFHKRVNRLSQMQIVPKAVTHEQAGAIPFFLVAGRDGVMNSLVATQTPKNEPRENSLIEIETTTLDTYSRESGHIPSMIKIDVEGAELWACQGAKHLLTHHRPALIVATHPPWLPSGQKIEDLFDLLATHGYKVVDSLVIPHKGFDFGKYLCLAD